MTGKNTLHRVPPQVLLAGSVMLLLLLTLGMGSVAALRYPADLSLALWRVATVGSLATLGLVGSAGLAWQRDTNARVTIALARAARQQEQTQRRLQEELRQEKARWECAFRGSNDALWDWDVQTSEICFSARCREMLGFPAQNHTGSFEAWQKSIHPDDLAPAMTLLQRHLARESKSFTAEFRQRSQDNSYRWVSVRGQAVWSEEGRATRVVGSQDVHERGSRGEAAAETKQDTAEGVFTGSLLSFASALGDSTPGPIDTPAQTAPVFARVAPLNAAPRQ